MSSHVLAVKDVLVDVNSQLALFTLGGFIPFGISPNQEIGIGVFALVPLLSFSDSGGFVVLRDCILSAINCV